MAMPAGLAADLRRPTEFFPAATARRRLVGERQLLNSALGRPLRQQLWRIGNVAKVEWGTKRQCQSCGARFYDLQRAEIVCPKCGVVYDPDTVTKKRSRSTAAVADKAVPVVEVPPAAPAEVSEELVETAAEAGEGGAGESEEEADAIIEDTSELGEDEDDMAEVMDNVEDEDER
jgi:uncharacterized protein (TIGR02300 family)